MKGNIIHGLRNHSLYTVWISIKNRCYNSSESKNKKYYYNNDIKIDVLWKNDFKSFYDWSLLNGYKKGLVIDRIDGTKDYTPQNCRWTTININNKNKIKRVVKSSKYFGVGFNKRANKWKSYIKIDKKLIHLGYFNSDIEALNKRNKYIQDNNILEYNIQEVIN